MTFNGIPFTKNWRTSSQVKVKEILTKQKQTKKKGQNKEKETKLKQNNKKQRQGVHLLRFRLRSHFPNEGFT